MSEPDEDEEPPVVEVEPIRDREVKEDIRSMLEEEEPYRETYIKFLY